jgi:hypothetical protein
MNGQTDEEAREEITAAAENILRRVERGEIPADSEVAKWAREAGSLALPTVKPYWTGDTFLADGIDGTPSPLSYLRLRYLRVWYETGRRDGLSERSGGYRHEVNGPWIPMWAYRLGRRSARR